jgi:SAM-dependent methyltransferase
MIIKEWNNQVIWEDRYSREIVLNRYPFNQIVSFILRNYGKCDRSKTRILDYGCGGGNHSVFLLKEGFDVYGIDYSNSAILHTLGIIRKDGFTPNEDNFICQDFLTLPFQDNFFDAVIDRQSLDQNPSSILQKLVNEIHRVIKPSGRYFGINFSNNHPELKFGSHSGNNDYSEFSTGLFEGIGSRHFFSASELKRLFNMFILEELKEVKEISLINKNSGNAEFIIQARKA